ncbi:HAD family hydrolase [Massilia sp. KIM]|nr:HAD family hydrolase [Massilia sp. KIM]
MPASAPSPAPGARRSAVFLDKDGTLLEDLPYNLDPARMLLAPGAAPALRRLARLGYRLFVVSNQAGLALGRFDTTALHRSWRHLRALLAGEGVRLDGFYYCPHHPDGTVPALATACTCRKPAPGLLRRAALEHRIDLPSSWMVGDILDDVEAGRRAGCRTVLLDVGNETEWLRSRWRWPDIVAGGFFEGAGAIPAPGLAAAPAHPGERP